MPSTPSQPSTDTASLRAWIDEFSNYVATLNYDRAAEMMALDVMSFSTWRDIVVGVEHWVNDQWKQVWPSMDHFHLESDKMHTVVSPDRLMAAVAVTWTSTGFHEDQTPFDRPGRCSFVLTRASVEEPWQAVQGHFSLHRGVPQQSHGARET